MTLVVLLPPTRSASAQNKTWTGAVSTSWQNGSNWSPLGAPISVNTVLVTPTAGNFDTANLFADVLMRSLDVEGGAAVHTQGNLLHVNGALGGDPGLTNILGSGELTEPLLLLLVR